MDLIQIFTDLLNVLNNNPIHIIFIGFLMLCLVGSVLYGVFMTRKYFAVIDEMVSRLEEQIEESKKNNQEITQLYNTEKRRKARNV